MKKTYTKKQISEAIKYWQKQLREINESDFIVGKDGLPYDKDGHCVNYGTHTYYVTIKAEMTNFMYITADTPEQAKVIAQDIINGKCDDKLDDMIETQNWSLNETPHVIDVEEND